MNAAMTHHVHESPEFIQEVMAHVNCVKDYINFVVHYDSWEEVVEAYPGIRGDACDAVLSLRFLMDMDIEEYNRKSILYGPDEMVGLYPWVADGMQWAWRQMQNAIVD